MWASPENPMKAFLYKTTTDSLKNLPRKAAMVRAKGTFGFHERSIVSYNSFNYSNMLLRKLAMGRAKDARKGTLDFHEEVILL